MVVRKVKPKEQVFRAVIREGTVNQLMARTLTGKPLILGKQWTPGDIIEVTVRLIGRKP